MTPAVQEATMQGCDFFAFCTSLKRPELKAIGELSWVRHMTKGEVLYYPGDPGNALYIVNKGVIEVAPVKGAQGEHNFYLSRGDVIGEVEVFSESPRTRLVRAHEETSLQCFPHANFQELVRRVPSFFRYLCEHMAERLINAREMAIAQHHALELSGRISTFDLTTIHQTVVNSGQTGELRIKDEHAETIGAFYFESGQLSAGQFEHLTGDEAFWQLFLIETLSGTFSFSAVDKPLTEWIQSAKMTPVTGDHLIVALQYRDEFNALKTELNPGKAKLTPLAPALHWNSGAPEHLGKVANQVWDVVSRKPGTITEVYRQCSACELKVYQVVDELMRSEQLAFATPPKP
jgi:CRP-like cAMP-binding protein